MTNPLFYIYLVIVLIALYIVEHVNSDDLINAAKFAFMRYLYRHT